jgi:hypothetical protein
MMFAAQKFCALLLPQFPLAAVCVVCPSSQGSWGTVKTPCPHSDLGNFLPVARVLPERDHLGILSECLCKVNVTVTSNNF